MPHPDRADLSALIAVLHEAGVEFIVVGGAAAVLHGAPVTTLDLDIVPRRSPDNLARLEALLSTLDAIVREPGDRRIHPTAAQLESGGQLNLSTRLGPLDSLGTLHDGRGFEELLPHTVRLTDGEITLVVLDLASLIEVKRTTGRAKDRLVVPVLLALLEQDGD